MQVRATLFMGSFEFIGTSAPGPLLRRWITWWWGHAPWSYASSVCTSTRLLETDTLRWQSTSHTISRPVISRIHIHYLPYLLQFLSPKHPNVRLLSGMYLSPAREPSFYWSYEARIFLWPLPVDCKQVVSWLYHHTKRCSPNVTNCEYR